MTAIAALVLALAGAQSAADVIVRNGEAIPDNVRPCVDYIGRGALRTMGEPTRSGGSDNLLGNGLYSFLFTKRETLLGKPFGGQRFVQEWHQLDSFVVDDAVVFVTRNEDGKARLTAFQRLWHDRRGRAFIPVYVLPAEGNMGLMPAATRRFMKPVSYASGQPGEYPVDADAGGGDPMKIKAGRHAHYRYGLYLGDLQGLMAAARSERCWR